MNHRWSLACAHLLCLLSRPPPRKHWCHLTERPSLSKAFSSVGGNSWRHSRSIVPIPALKVNNSRWGVSRTKLTSWMPNASSLNVLKIGHGWCFRQSATLCETGQAGVVSSICEARDLGGMVTKQNRREKSAPLAQLQDARAYVHSCPCDLSPIRQVKRTQPLFCLDNK